MLDKIRNSHLFFAEERGIEKTYCPSEVARKLFPENWRDKMNLVREMADELVKSGMLVVLQKGEISLTPPSKLSGPIRLQKKGSQ